MELASHSAVASSILGNILLATDFATSKLGEASICSRESNRVRTLLLMSFRLVYSVVKTMMMQP